MATPPTITSSGGGNSATVQVPENQLAIMTVTATDPDPGTTIRYSITGGADQFRLTINSNSGALAFFDSIYTNYERPFGSGPGGAYLVQVTASDGSLTDAQDITVQLTNVNEPPQFSFGGSLRSIAIDENSNFQTHLSATDPDDGTILNFSIVGGADKDKFSMNSATALLSLIAPVDFEHPTDADHNNGYVVQVRVSDGELFADQTIILNVDNVNEAPVFTPSSASVSVVENTNFVTQVIAQDPEGSPVTYSISGSSQLQIDPNSGSLSFINPAHYDPSGFNNFIFASVLASDGSLSNFFSVSINILPAPKPHWMASADLGVRSTPYQVAGIGDFDKDGTSDILWRDPTTGKLDEWHIVNGQWAGSTDLGSHGADWQVAGIGDLDGDGTGNILWRNPSTGQMDEWRMGGGNWAGTVPLGSHGADWTVGGLGDFNGDGTDDILWRNPATGQMDEWRMSNGNWSASIAFGSHGTGWIVAGIGDFNKDGNDDVLWRNPTTGQVDEWKLVNGQWAGSIDLGSYNIAYQVAGIGDFNGDSTSDILWYNQTSGANEIWIMANGQWSGSVGLGPHAAGWTPTVGNFNADTFADILWRQTATGHVEEWLISMA